MDVVVAEFESTSRMPPMASPSGDVLVVVFLAREMKASRVLPVVGALIAPTMPEDVVSETILNKIVKARCTQLTVVSNCLAAVEPDWLRVVYDNREAGSGKSVLGWDKAREEAAAKRMTGIGKGGLNDRMILHSVLT